jgi:nicotinate-nucleotide pyrophosphorylase (carboxylating)
MPVHQILIDESITRALLEDIGHGCDLTSSIIKKGTERKATAITRQPGIICGLDCAQTAFKKTDPEIIFERHIEDGAEVKAGDEIFTVKGCAANMLTAERTALNFLTFLSGIATTTNMYVRAIGDQKSNIVCTRKTMPGLRVLQKYAVKTGGGMNHRFGLDDAILIKDNHIALCGDIDTAIKRAIEIAGHMVKIEVEVDTLDQLEKVLSYNVDAVLLDNLENDKLSQAVSMVDGKILTEASGGIELDRVRSIAETGVDLISVGALTHSFKTLDIGLDVKT